QRAADFALGAAFAAGFGQALLDLIGVAHLKAQSLGSIELIEGAHLGSGALLGGSGGQQRQHGENQRGQPQRNDGCAAPQLIGGGNPEQDPQQRGWIEIADQRQHQDDEPDQEAGQQSAEKADTV